MLESINKRNIFFLDIETVSQFLDYQNLPDAQKTLWDHKATKLKQDENDTPEKLYERAGIYSEFGKIICISVGFFNKDKFRVKSFVGDDEKALLSDFAEILNKDPLKSARLLCAHNGKEFDFPYIARRMLINKIKIPMALRLAGKKPWEVPHLDTMDLWRFGDYKNYTSLELLANVFSIPSPKDDLKGSEVGKAYWKENDLERIKQYCERDVITIARLFQCYCVEPFFGDDAVEIV